MEEGGIAFDNLYSLYRDIGKYYPDSKIYDFNKFQIIENRKSEWPPNIAFDICDDLDDEVIVNIEKEMMKLGIHPFLVTKFGDDSFSRLRGHGFRPVEQWQEMCLDDLKEFEIPLLPEGVEISILDGAEIDIWNRIVSELLFRGKYLDPVVFDILRENGVKIIGLKFERQMVGTSMIYYDNSGNAGIYMVGVKNEFRGRGLGKILMQFCIDEIRKAGKNRCFLQSTKAGNKLYNSLKFDSLSTYFLYRKM